MNPNQLAKGAGITYPTARKIWFDQSKMVDFTTLQKLTGFLACKPHTLIKKTPPKEEGTRPLAEAAPGTTADDIAKAMYAAFLKKVNVTPAEGDEDSAFSYHHFLPDALFILSIVHAE
jgi:DNA-binding Xre family transcriptional regulator